MKPALRAAAIGAGAAILLFTALGRADLFKPDEPREAEMAREMWSTGALLVPHLNGEPFLEKPPLFYWLVITAYGAAGGPGELSARFVPALAGLLTVLLLYLFGRRMVGAPAAALAALVLLTAFQFFWTARRCMIDMPLTLAVLIACGALHRGIVIGGRRRLAWLALGYLAVGASVMFKGVIGAGIPALAVAGYIAARRDWRGIVRHGLLPGAALALLPVVAWTTALGRGLGAGAVRDFVWVNNVLRFSGGAQRGHENPFYYYLPTILTDFAPWSLALPIAVVAAWMAARRSGAVGAAAGRDAGDPEGRSLVYLLSWFLLPLVVLSIASTKRGIYLLPIYPAAALLVGRWLAGMSASRSPGPAAAPDRAASVGRGLLMAETILLVALGLVALILVGRADRLAPTALLVLTLPAGIAMYRALRRADGPRLGLMAAALTGVVYLSLSLVTVPRAVARWATDRPVAVELRRMIEAGDDVALYDFKQGMIGGLLFYTGRTFANLDDPAALRDHLAARPAPSAGPIAVALIREDEYEKLGDRLGLPTAVVRRFLPGREESPLDDRRRALVLVAAMPADRSGLDGWAGVAGVEPGRRDQ